MLKTKIFIIIIVIYLISFIAIKTNINLFYPYYLIKDFIFFPVLASKEDIKLDNLVLEGINIELKNELDELKEINNLSSTLTDFDSVSALIIERNKMYWFNTITINKGKKDGLKEDMAVISSKGLIGKINKVGNNTSEVKLITTSDINSKISVMIRSDNDIIYGIMSGYDKTNNYLEVISTNKITNIKENSLVYTSGMGGIFPSGILIGNVDSITTDKYEVSKIINVKPNSDFNNMKFVKVLIRK